MFGFVKKYATGVGVARDIASGVVSFRNAFGTASVLVILQRLIQHFESRLSSSVRVQTEIVGTRPDRFVLHDFDNLELQEHITYKDVKDETGNVVDRVSSVLYSVTGFVSPNGTPLNNLTGLLARPHGNTYPVRLKNESLDGGTVFKPSEYWNECEVTVEHEGRTQLLVREHNEECSDLVGKGWDLYMDSEDGVLKTHNAEAYKKAILQMSWFVITVEIAVLFIRMGLLGVNFLYVNYRLSSSFDGKLGTLGEAYKKWWVRAFNADKTKELAKAAGAVGNGSMIRVMNTVTDDIGYFEMFSDVIALSYLKQLSTAVKPEDMSKKHVRSNVVTLLLARVVIFVVFLLIVAGVCGKYMFDTVLLVEKGNDRSYWDYLFVIVSSVIITFVLRNHVSFLHKVWIRKKFKDNMKHRFDIDLSDFPIFDHARLAL